MKGNKRVVTRSHGTDPAGFKRPLKNLLLPLYSLIYKYTSVLNISTCSKPHNQIYQVHPVFLDMCAFSELQWLHISAHICHSVMLKTL